MSAYSLELISNYVQSFLVMPQNGAGPEWSNLKRCFEVLITLWNLPVAPPSMGKGGSAHAPRSVPHALHTREVTPVWDDFT